jgi:(4S)-4-hydroxy-5-phosphonooxypentane-2,3-dione isomerase
MIATFVHVWLKPAFIDDFIEACKTNHNESVKEPGNLRFDILQDASDPAKFTLYEAYQSEEASKAHKETKHYQLWRDTVSDWMAKPREGVKHHIIAPLNPSEW